MSSKIYLFPDTNLFIQCQPLENLDWSVLGAFDNIDLLVCRPVQAEIDSHKSKGNTRLASRARGANSLLRSILGATEKCVVVRKANPTVRIYLRQELRRDEALEDQLSYDEHDDQLVGIASMFAKNNPDEEVRILTHDTGPMATAQMIGLGYFEIPESWLLTPEADENEKKIKKLEAELKQLKKAEPNVELRFGSLEMGNSPLEVCVSLLTPVPEGHIASMMQRIAQRFPVETDFGAREFQTRRRSEVSFTLYSDIEEFNPASDNEIEVYRTKSYPNWLQNCESLLRSLHEKINAKVAWPKVTFSLRNAGSRPADDTLVTLSAGGSFKIMPPPRAGNDGEQEPGQELALPRPPSAPKGLWRVKRMSPLGIYESNSLLARASSRAVTSESLISALAPRARDPNRFYYQNFPESPVESFSFSCKQWRHGDEEVFGFHVHFDLKPGTICGAFSVKVQAANMSENFIKHLPVRVTIQEVCALFEAELLVEELIDRRF